MPDNSEEQLICYTCVNLETGQHRGEVLRRKFEGSPLKFVFHLNEPHAVTHCNGGSSLGNTADMLAEHREYGNHHAKKGFRCIHCDTWLGCSKCAGRPGAMICTKCHRPGTKEAQRLGEIVAPGGEWTAGGKLSRGVAACTSKMRGRQVDPLTEQEIADETARMAGLFTEEIADRETEEQREQAKARIRQQQQDLLQLQEAPF